MNTVIEYFLYVMCILVGNFWLGFGAIAMLDTEHRSILVDLRRCAPAWLFVALLESWPLVLAAIAFFKVQRWSLEKGQK